MTDKPETMDELVERLKRLDAEATKGQWERFNYIGHVGGLYLVRSQNGKICQAGIGSGRDNGPNDAAFIVALRNALPSLLAERERLRRSLQNLLTVVAVENDERSRSPALVSVMDSAYAALSPEKQGA